MLASSFNLVPAILGCRPKEFNYGIPTFPFIKTRNPNEFREALASKLYANKVEVETGDRPFEISLNLVELTNVDLMWRVCTAPHTIHVLSADRFRQHFALQKSGYSRFGQAQFTISSTESAVIPSGAEVINHHEADFEGYILRMKPAALQSKLGAIIGAPITLPLQFVTPSRFSDPSLRRLMRILQFMATELDREDAPISPAAVAEFEQLLIVSFLHGNHHNFTEQLIREPRSPAPWQVHLVEDYIEANWNLPITVEALASAAGASMRSVFKAFRDARGYSPMAFVKRIRLSHARRMLEQSDDTRQLLRWRRPAGSSIQAILPPTTDAPSANCHPRHSHDPAELNVPTLVGS